MLNWSIQHTYVAKNTGDKFATCRTTMMQNTSVIYKKNNASLPIPVIVILRYGTNFHFLIALELWRKENEIKGMRIRRSKTLPPYSGHDSNVKLGGEEIENVTTFKYLGSMFDAEGGSNTSCMQKMESD